MATPSLATIQSKDAILHHNDKSDNQMKDQELNKSDNKDKKQQKVVQINTSNDSKISNDDATSNITSTTAPNTTSNQMDLDENENEHGNHNENENEDDNQDENGQMGIDEIQNIKQKTKHNKNKNEERQKDIDSTMKEIDEKKMNINKNIVSADASKTSIKLNDKSDKKDEDGQMDIDDIPDQKQNKKQKTKNNQNKNEERQKDIHSTKKEIDEKKINVNKNIKLNDKFHNDINVNNVRLKIDESCSVIIIKNKSNDTIKIKKKTNMVIQGQNFPLARSQKIKSKESLVVYIGHDSIKAAHVYGECIFITFYSTIRLKKGIIIKFIRKGVTLLEKKINKIIPNKKEDNNNNFDTSTTADIAQKKKENNNNYETTNISDIKRVQDNDNNDFETTSNTNTMRKRNRKRKQRGDIDKGEIEDPYNVGIPNKKYRQNSRTRKFISKHRSKHNKNFVVNWWDFEKIDKKQIKYYNQYTS